MKRSIPRRALKTRRKPPKGLCTRTQRNIIYSALEMGLPVQRAVEVAGVIMEQHTAWMQKGLDPDSGKYYFYRKRILDYKMQREAEALDVIRKAQNGGAKLYETKISMSKNGREVTKTVKTLAPKWTAAAWYLERVYSEQYAAKVNQESEKETPEQLAKAIRESLNAIDQSVPDSIMED